MELTKTDSKMLQGLSVLAMVWLHLFDRNYEGLFTPLIFVWKVPLSFYVAQLSDFCVFGFAFLSGYAHMKLFNQSGYYRHRLKSLFSTFCNYWTVLIVFSLLGYAIGQGEFMPGNFRKFVLNATTIENSYNGAWWYLFDYSLLVVISPAILSYTKKCHSSIVFGFGFIIYCASYYVRFFLNSSSWILEKCGTFGMTFFEYIIGALVMKHGFFTYIYNIFEKIPSMIRRSAIVTMLLGMLYVRTKIVPSMFVAPISGFVILMMFHFWDKPRSVKSFFLFIGKHSTNIWLTHMFFYLVLFKDLVYAAKFPILIFTAMIAITILVSTFLQWIEKPIQRQIKKV